MEQKLKLLQKSYVSIRKLMLKYRKKYENIEFQYSIKGGLTCNYFSSLPESVKKEMIYIQWNLYNSLKDIVSDDYILLVFDSEGTWMTVGHNFNDVRVNLPPN